MTHGTQVVDLIGLGLLDDLGQVQGVGEISVMKDQVAVIHMGVLVKVVDPFGVEHGCPAFDPVNDVSFFQ